MNTFKKYITPVTRAAGEPDAINGLLLALLIILIILGLILILVALYGVAAMRRRTVVLKKVDYLVEDITYKSESLNVTVETLNKVSNYALSMDALSKNGLKATVKLISENRNYIYSILDKMRQDVEAREAKEGKKTTEKVKTTSTKAKKDDKSEG